MTGRVFGQQLYLQMTRLEGSGSNGVAGWYIYCWYHNPYQNTRFRILKSVSEKYLKTLLTYYEEEVSGEAYFYGLVPFLGEEEKLGLLARVERQAADSVLPLIAKYGLTPRGADRLRQEGIAHVNRHSKLSWREFMHHIVDYYPVYLEEFAELESMAPDEDLDCLRKLTHHEVLAIEFARRELAEDASSMESLKAYLGK